MWKETGSWPAFGQLDFLALRAIRELREHSFGMAIVRRVSDVSGRKVSSGRLYMVLERLERNGYVESCIIEPTSPNGYPKRFFRLRGPGEKLLSELTQTAGRLADAVAEAQSYWWRR